MILSALYGYYKRTAGQGENSPPLLGFENAKVSGAIQIDLDGQFLGILDMRQSQIKGKPRPCLMSVPQPPVRTVGIKAGFLCDAAGYCLGYDGKGKPERAQETFAASREIHETLLQNCVHPVAQAILRFYEQWTPQTDTETLTAYAEEMSNWLVFAVHNEDGQVCFAHAVPELQEIWMRHSANSASDILGQCLVTGRENVPIARLHGKVKGVREAQSSGASLVSFNFDAATSYGKTQSFNAPVSEEAAFGYVAALNSFLQPNNPNNRFFGDTTYIFWAERETPAESLMAALFDPPLVDEKKAANDEIAMARRIQGTLDCLARGRPLTDPDLLQSQDVQFYILGLAPNAARVSVRLWMVDTINNYLSHLGQHLEDLSLIKDHPDRTSYPSLWSLASQVHPKDQDGKTRGKNAGSATKKLCGDLFRAMISGSAYPASLLPLLLDRFRNDRYISHPRVALLKAYLTRWQRITQPNLEELPMALDENRTEIGYRLGRLFAVLERLQEAALGNTVNASIRDKFIASASATPATVYPYLLSLSLSHMKKARRKSAGSAVFFDKLIQSISNDLHEFPLVLSPTDQGLFFLGYYQQRQVFFQKHTAETNEVAAE